MVFVYYLSGLVLFPEATLPLTVARQSFKAAIETAMNRVDAPLTLGVVCQSAFYIL